LGLKTPITGNVNPKLIILAKEERNINNNKNCLLLFTDKKNHKEVICIILNALFF